MLSVMKSLFELSAIKVLLGDLRSLSFFFLFFSSGEAIASLKIELGIRG